MSCNMPKFLICMLYVWPEQDINNQLFIGMFMSCNMPLICMLYVWPEQDINNQLFICMFTSCNMAKFLICMLYVWLLYLERQNK